MTRDMIRSIKSLLSLYSGDLTQEEVIHYTKEIEDRIPSIKILTLPYVNGEHGISGCIPDEGFEDKLTQSIMLYLQYASIGHLYVIDIDTIIKTIINKIKELNTKP